MKKRVFGRNDTQVENSHIGGNNGTISISEVLFIQHTGLSSLCVLIYKCFIDL